MFIKELFSLTTFWKNIKSSFSTKGELNRLQFLTYNLHIFSFFILIQIMIGLSIPLILPNNNPKSIQGVISFQRNFASIIFTLSVITTFLLFISQNTGIIKRLHNLQLGWKTYFIIVMSVLLLLSIPFFVDPDLKYNIGLIIMNLVYRLGYFILFIYFLIFILLFLPGRKIEESNKE